MISLSFLDYFYKNLGGIYGFSKHICPPNLKINDLMIQSYNNNKGKYHIQCFLSARNVQSTLWTLPLATLTHTVRARLCALSSYPSNYRKAWRSWELLHPRLFTNPATGWEPLFLNYFIPSTGPRWLHQREWVKLDYPDSFSWEIGMGFLSEPSVQAGYLNGGHINSGVPYRKASSARCMEKQKKMIRRKGQEWRGHTEKNKEDSFPLLGPNASWASPAVSLIWLIENRSFSLFKKCVDKQIMWVIIWKSEPNLIF